MADFAMHADGLNSLAADLTRAGLTVGPRAAKVVEVGANKIKQTAQQLSSGLAHAPHYPQSISYDMVYGPTSIAAEIGPDKARPQGALGNILEYGTANNPPFAHLGPALDLEAPQVERHLGDIVGDV